MKKKIDSPTVPSSYISLNPLELPEIVWVYIHRIILVATTTTTITTTHLLPSCLSAFQSCLSSLLLSLLLFPFPILISSVLLLALYFSSSLFSLSGVFLTLLVLPGHTFFAEHTPQSHLFSIPQRDISPFS